jgi:hypothetical protein
MPLDHNSHVLDYYLWLATRPMESLSQPYVPFYPYCIHRYIIDFDIETEQREGWYDPIQS